MNILAIDLSFAKTGVAVINVKDRIPSVVFTDLVVSNKNKDSADRIDGLITTLRYYIHKYDIDSVVKESSIIRQVSSATPVIKTHAVFEHEVSPSLPIVDVSNSTVKKWARIVTNSDGKRKDKEMIAEAVEKYYGKLDGIRTTRGRLLDDVTDAIALGTLWLEQEDIIDVKFERS